MSELAFPALLSLETSRTTSIQYMLNIHGYNLCNHTCLESMQSHLGARLNRMHHLGKPRITNSIKVSLQGLFTPGKDLLFGNMRLLFTTWHYAHVFAISCQSSSGSNIRDGLSMIDSIS